MSKHDPNTTKHEIRPASAEEAGLFYAMSPEQDAELGCIGHVRIDFGRGGDRFYHTWHPRGPGELNTQEFKDELTEVVDELRESVLKNYISMTGYCRNYGGEISGGRVQNYGYIVETENYRYCLRCNPVPSDYQAYLTCFDKRAQEMNLGRTLKITDYSGNPVTLRPRLELYSVTDFMGTEMPGLAVVLDEVGDSPADSEQYAVLTVSFGEFISIKNSAYIDTNNCPFAEQLLRQGIAEPTGLCKTSGYCQYPLWVFKEEFLREIGGENYQKYAQSYEQYMKPSEDEEPVPLEIHSLAALKRAIKPGTELMATYHSKHPETVGLVRVVTEVQTNGFYSILKDQPDHTYSTYNHGRGFRTDYEKASCYQFDGTTIRVLDTRKNDGSVLFEFEVYEPRMEMEAQEETEESFTMTMGGM